MTVMLAQTATAAYFNILLSLSQHTSRQRARSVTAIAHHSLAHNSFALVLFACLLLSRRACLHMYTNIFTHLCGHVLFHTLGIVSHASCGHVQGTLLGTNV